MSLARYLARLGYGTRKEMEQLIRMRRVTTADGTSLRDDEHFVHEAVRVDGAPLDPPPGSVILLHKPLGYVCSTSDRPPLVYDLLPPRLLHRDPVMAAVGRLDAETTGLLLLTDDGQLNHQLTSPKWHLPKRYAVTLAEPLRGDEADVFASGTLMLRGEDTPVRAAQLDVGDGPHVQLTITEGRYHQVRRMFAAVGHHVTALERIAFGPLSLGSLPSGGWRVLTATECDALRDALREAVRAAKTKSEVAD